MKMRIERFILKHLPHSRPFYIVILLYILYHLLPLTHR